MIYAILLYGYGYGLDMTLCAGSGDMSEYS